MSDLEVLCRLAAGSAPSEDEVDRARGARDYSEEIPSLFEKASPTHPIPNLTDEQISELISDEAHLKLIEFEVTSEQVYRRKYERPVAPAGESGITIGIGYDLGWSKPEAVRRDLAGLVSNNDIEKLTQACGLRGNEARRRLPEFGHIRLPWEAAIEVYRRSTAPRYGRDVLCTFPNAVELKGHCFGALMSLVYNRGADLAGERRVEMRAIREFMDERQWLKIPEQFRKMKRLWQGQSGLEGVVKRRETEAVLFERGIELLSISIEVAAQGSTLESRTELDPVAVEGDGYFYKELEDDGAKLERADPNWNRVVWPPYDRAPDYSHIPDRSLTDSSFLFGPRELEFLIEANGFKPTREHGRIVFALRGAQLVQGLETGTAMERQENREALTLKEVKPDHKSFRCVIGVYEIERGRMHGYLASTAPNPKAVASYVAGGDPANMMLTGCYEFEVGWHQPSKPEKKIPGCLIENGRRKAVQRTSNDYSYELNDVVDNTTPGDNVHPGKSEGPFPFSSWGCLVLKGSVNPLRGGVRENIEHVGEWARFRKMLGLPDRGTGAHGRRFDVVLCTGLDGAIAAKALNDGLDPAGDIVRRQLYRLRQGSHGWRVAILRRGLGMPVGERFDAAVASKLAEKQRAATGKADGTYSPATDEAFGFGVFSAQLVAQPESRGTNQATSPGLQHDKLAYELGAFYEASRRGHGPGGDNQLEGLGATILDMGTTALVSTGNALIGQARETLRGYVCGTGGVAISRDIIRRRIDIAAKTGLGYLKQVLVGILKQATFSFAPTSTLEWLVDFILDDFIVPQTGDVAAAVVQRIEGGVDWLCSTWTTGTVINTPPRRLAEQPTTVREPPPASGTAQVEASRLLARVEAEAAVGNIQGMRSKNQIAGAVERDPYELITDIEEALGETPLDKAKVNGHVRALCDLLGDAQLRMDADLIEKTLKGLRRHRFSDQISWLSDCVLTRDHDPALLARVSPYYALSLIDDQKIVAGIEILHAALERGGLNPEISAEVYGGLGRAHKQIYVNHVRSAADALALRETMGSQLARSVECYGRIYDPSQPAAAYWHGINLIALAKRAIADGIAIPSQQNPDELARALIAALEPKAAGTDDHYLLATLGEGYLAIGEMDKAALHYSSFAKHANTDAFALNGAARQLEQVWRIKCGQAGAGSILVGLKGTLAQKDGGQITLSAPERQAITSATATEHQEFFESRTNYGKFVPLEYLKRIVNTGAAVAAIKQKPRPTQIPGSGSTIGTGFLVDGSSLGLESGKSYLLTNAHVLWDTSTGQGRENHALAPNAADIVFEAADGENRVFECAEVIWQSPSALHDCALLALKQRVDGIKPLTLAGTNVELRADDGSGKTGTPLAVVGHPEGGALQIGLSGTLEEISARLVDKGPRGNSSDPEYLHYTVPTEPGNSGSPVLETSNWQVVGLHHAGFDTMRGRARLGNKAGTNHANEGIWVESIRNAVKETRVKKRRRWFG